MGKQTPGYKPGHKPGVKQHPSAAEEPAVTRSRHQVRIIGGLWKRSKLPVVDVAGLRPTPDRVRETLFNWLGQDLSGWRCIDVFAGTGALGFEAASRGALEVWMVEQDRGLADQLRATQSRLHAETVHVRQGDGLHALQQLAPESMDIVFLDPPFHSTLFDGALRYAVAALKPTGFIYLEAPLRWDEAALARSGLAMDRHLKAGAVHAHLLKRSTVPHA